MGPVRFMILVILVGLMGRLPLAGRTGPLNLAGRTWPLALTGPEGGGRGGG